MSDTLHILFVDDDAQIRLMGGTLLRQEFPGARVDEVDSVTSLARALEAGEFSIVVTDYQLGWTDGVAVLREVKRRDPDCPVIMFTATGSEEIAVEAMKAGLDDYVLKSPKHIGRLPAAIRLALEQAERRRHLKETEARHRSLLDVLDTSAVAVLTLDADWTVQWANAAFERYFGLPRDRVIGRDKRQLLRDAIGSLVDHPADFAARILRTYEERHCVESFTCHIPAGEGREERWLEHRSLPILTGPYAGGRIEHYYDITERKRAEARLADLLRQQDLLLASLPVAIYRARTDGDYAAVWISDSVTRVTGFAPDRFTEDPGFWLARVHPEDRGRVLQDTEAGVSGGGYAQEYRWQCADGTYHWFADQARVVTGPEGGDREIVGVWLDITAQKRIDEALREHETRLRLILDNAEVGLWDWNMTTDDVALDEKWNLILGYGPTERLPNRLETWRTTLHPKDAPEVYRVLEAHLNDANKLYDVVYRARHKSGRWIWINSRGRVVERSADGRPTRMMGTIHDVTERKRAEEALREASDRLNSVVEASPIAITVLDLEGRVQLWNPAAQALFQWAEAEVIGQRLPTVPPERLAEHRDIRARACRGEVIRDLEVLRRRKDGSLVTIVLSIVLLRDAAGAPQGFLGMMEDVTERKRMEAQALRIERIAAFGQLLGGIAHEIKNPLFVLTGRLQLLREKAAGRDYATIPADIEKTEEAAKRMSHIMERFLKLAKPIQPQRARCAIRTVLEQTLDFLANELAKNQVRLVAELSPDLPSVLADPHELQEVFLNLMLNAVQAMASSHGLGTLTVSAKAVTDSETRGQGKGEKWVEVKIQDDGPGILPEHRARLFEPFFSTKPPEEGTGLGLWTVRTIVMSLKGRVTCETDVGRGTTFTVRLPVSDEPLTIAQN